jgi:hypothetical protein
LLNCCVPGTTNCSGACTTTGIYTTNDGACTGACNTAYVRLRDQCTIVLNERAGTYTQSSCSAGCGAAFSNSCRDNLTSAASESECSELCHARGFSKYGVAKLNVWTTRCYCCN